MKRKSILYLIIFFLCLEINAQTNKNAIIKGSVVEKENGKALPGASIYLAYKKIGTIADPKGKFEFTTNMFGEFELVVSMVGYSIQKKEIDVKPGKEYEFSFKLEVNPVEINAVEVIVDDPVEWKKNLQIFLKEFNTYNHKEELVFSNLEYLEFKWINGFLTAYTDKPIIMSSKTKGFLNDLRLVEFIYNPSTHQAIISRGFWFKEDTATYKNSRFDDSLKAKWLNVKKEIVNQGGEKKIH